MYKQPFMAAARSALDHSKTRQENKTGFERQENYFTRQQQIKRSKRERNHEEGKGTFGNVLAL